MSNYVQKFTLDGDDILCKDSEARSSLGTMSSDINSLGNRVTALEGLSRLTISYVSASESIVITTGTHSS